MKNIYKDIENIISIVPVENLSFDLLWPLLDESVKTPISSTQQNIFSTDKEIDVFFYLCQLLEKTTLSNHFFVERTVADFLLDKSHFFHHPHKPHVDIFHSSQSPKLLFLRKELFWASLSSLTKQNKQQTFAKIYITNWASVRILRIMIWTNMKSTILIPIRWIGDYFSEEISCFGTFQDCFNENDIGIWDDFHFTLMLLQ